MSSPLTIGVTLGGQLLDLVAPRPKLRAGSPPELSLLSGRGGTRTAAATIVVGTFVDDTVATGSFPRTAGR